MSYKNLAAYIRDLETSGQLRRIGEEVDPHLEIAQWADVTVKKGGPALLFEKPKGHGMPLLINHYGTQARMARALGVADVESLRQEIAALAKPRVPEGLGDGFKTLIKMLAAGRHLIPKKVGSAPCQDVVHKDPDLSLLPILHCWPEDGGRFITLPMVVTRHPETGIRNVGMYRMQVYDKKTTGMHWHRHKDGPRHFQAYRRLGIRRMPVSVALGGDPALTWAATAPCPEGLDEFAFAGFIRKKPVEMVKCLTNDLEVPAESEIVLEGWVDPEESRLEGPFGDHTGYYSLEDQYPVFHVECLTHRKNPVYPATIVGRPLQEDGFMGTASVRLFLPLLQTVFPEIADMDLPVDGIFHNLMIVSLKKSYPFQGRKLMNSIWGSGQMMFTKCVVVVDEGVDVHNPAAVMEEIGKNFAPETDLVLSEGPVDALDHAARDPYLGGKIGLDATTKTAEEGGSRRQGLKDPKKPAGARGFRTYGPLATASILKTKGGQGRAFLTQAAPALAKAGIKILTVSDADVDVEDPAQACWRVGTCLDPRQDAFLVGEGDKAILCLDATAKLKEEGHLRPWPRVIEMSEEVVRRVSEQMKRHFQ